MLWLPAKMQLVVVRIRIYLPLNGWVQIEGMLHTFTTNSDAANICSWRVGFFPGVFARGTKDSDIQVPVTQLPTSSSLTTVDATSCVGFKSFKCFITVFTIYLQGSYYPILCLLWVHREILAQGQYFLILSQGQISVPGYPGIHVRGILESRHLGVGLIIITKEATSCVGLKCS